ncbi:MAG TPA: hypothetical protein VGF61_15075 [Candidatus Acidoferrum sp.]
MHSALILPQDIPSLRSFRIAHASLKSFPALWKLRGEPFAFVLASMYVATTATTLPSWSGALVSGTRAADVVYSDLSR